VSDKRDRQKYWATVVFLLSWVGTMYVISWLIGG
jgi:hypothetical protein